MNIRLVVKMAVTRKNLVFGGVIALLAVAITVAAVIFIMVQNESDKENKDEHNGHDGHHGHHGKCGYEVRRSTENRLIS